jgi:tetratricopeptide (TPR) repeat protein
MLFDDQHADLRHVEEWEAVFFPLGDRIDPESARVVDYDKRDFRTEPPADTVFVLSDAPLEKSSFFKSAETAIENHLQRNQTVAILRNRQLKLYSRVGETEEAFGERCLAVAEDRADEASEKLRDRYERKLKTARGKMDSAERRVRELEVDVGQRKQQEIVSGVGDVLSMFLGGRRRTRSISGLASRRSMTRRTRERLRTAEEKLEDYEEAIMDLEEELEDELKEIWDEWQAKASDVEQIEVGLERTDIQLTEMVLFWAPAE